MVNPFPTALKKSVKFDLFLLPVVVNDIPFWGRLLEQKAHIQQYRILRIVGLQECLTINTELHLHDLLLQQVNWAVCRFRNFLCFLLKNIVPHWLQTLKMSRHTSIKLFHIDEMFAGHYWNISGFVFSQSIIHWLRCWYPMLAQGIGLQPSQKKHRRLAQLTRSIHSACV